VCVCVCVRVHALTCTGNITPGMAPQHAPLIHYRQCSVCDCVFCLQETLPLAWHHIGPAASVPTLKPLALHTHGPPTTILAAGASAAVLVSEHGRPLSTLWLPHAPSIPLVRVCHVASYHTYTCAHTCMRSTRAPPPPTSICIKWVSVVHVVDMCGMVLSCPLLKCLANPHFCYSCSIPTSIA